MKQHFYKPENRVNPMKLKKVQYFLKIVEKGSLSKAANSVGLIQPTLTRFLAGLEKRQERNYFPVERIIP